MQPTELETFKSQLLAMRSRLTHEVGEITNAIPEDITATGDLSTVPTHPADSDAEGVDRNVALAQNEAGMLEAVEQALDRMEQGTFGVCQACGTQIDVNRLRAIPYTPYCIRCARAMEREGTD